MAITALGVGSGLDLSGLLDQLKEGERQKLVPLMQQKQSYKTTISAYGQLESLLSQFQGAAEKLNDPSLFQSTKSSVDGDAIKAAAGSDAAVGSYSVDVGNLAKASSVATEGVDDKTRNLGAGTITLTLGSGAAERTVTAAVEAESSSLEDIRDAINAQGADVRASIVNDGDPANPYRLVLASTTTGTDSQIYTDAASFDGLLTADPATSVAAENAALTINNIPVSSQTNQIEEAIEGVTLSLVEESLSTLEISSDKPGMAKAVKDFVAAYNSLQTSVDSMTSYDAESGSAGTLLGDSTLRNIESYVRSAMSNGGGEGAVNLLSEVGISLQLDGTLELDEEALTGLLDSDPAAVSEFFAGTGSDGTNGFTDRLESTLNQILKDKGVLNNATTGLKSSITRLDERSAQMEKGIEATIARYRAQFGQLDSMIASMNSTSAYLTQQFDMMNAQLGQG